MLLDLFDHALVILDLLLDVRIGDSFRWVALLPRLRLLINTLLTCRFDLLAQPGLDQREDGGDLRVGLADVDERF